MVRIGRFCFSANAMFLAFNVSPSNWFFSCNTPAPVHDADSRAFSSSSIPKISDIFTVEVYNSGQAPRETPVSYTHLRAHET